MIAEKLLDFVNRIGAEYSKAKKLKDEQMAFEFN